MPKHPDFVKIHKRFTKQYGDEKGKSLYSNWIKKKGYDDTKPFPNSMEKKEKRCVVRGLEVKEFDGEYHIEGLIATSHVDQLDMEDGIEIPDVIPKKTLESFSEQMNTTHRARLMGVHHSEGRPFNAEYFGEADIDKTPTSVVPLSDGEYGLFVDTKLLKGDSETLNIIKGFESKDLNSFSITYDTNGFETADFEWIGNKLVRRIDPATQLWGYTAASDPVNKEAVAIGFGFKEFKEMIKTKTEKEEINMSEGEEKPKDEAVNQGGESPVNDKPVEGAQAPAEESTPEDAEQKEFRQWKKEKAILETKELVEKTVSKAIEGAMSKMEVKEKVLTGNESPGKEKEVLLEVKEFRAMLDKPVDLEIKEQFRRAAAYSDVLNVDFRTSTTSRVEDREFKAFRTNGRMLEYKGLGLTTNQETDTDYLQSTAELQDVYDPIIYNALNQETLTWNILAKDDFSKKGNNKIQFTLKTAANTSAQFYTDNAVVTGNVSRLKNETKFKKVQVGVCVDGDMIAAARGGPVQDVFAQEVLDSTMDMLAVVNAALYAETGAESAAAVIGFEYIADSAGNTTLYNKTRSTTNKLAPASAGDTYINGSSAPVTMINLRSMKRQATNEGAKKRSLVYFTSPVQADIMRSKYDDQRRMLSPRDTGFGFSTDLFVDGIPVFEDIDCNTDDWFCVDLDTHRIGIWVPATIERLGKTADSEDAFVKMYFGTYNRRPRALSMCYGNATSL